MSGIEEKQTNTNNRIFDYLFDEEGNCKYDEGSIYPRILDFNDKYNNQIWTEGLDFNIVAYLCLKKYLDIHPEFKYDCDAIQLYHLYKVNNRTDGEFTAFNIFSPKIMKWLTDCEEQETEESTEN